MSKYINILRNDFYFFTSTLRNFFSKDNFAKPFFIVFSIYLIGYAALLRANVYYVDDLGRSLWGYRGWDDFSRYSSNYLSEILNFSSRLTDISPFSQLIALSIVTIASLILIRVFTKKNSYPLLFSSTIIGLNPFFLENISYKFDSPYMAIALLSSLFGFLFIENKRVFCVVSFFSLLLMFTTYQAANAVFIMVSIFLVFYYYLNDKKLKDIFILISIVFGVFLFSTIFYKVFIVTEVNSYVTSSTFPIKYIIPGAIKNLKYYIDILKSSFFHNFIFIIFLSIVMLIEVNILINNKRKILSSVVFLLFLLLGILSSFGLYCILQKPLWAPRAFYGIGGYVAILSIILLGYSRNKIMYYMSSLVTMLFVINLIVISNTYGNALAVQQKYSDFRAVSMLQDLISMTNNKDITIHANGAISNQQVVQNAVDAYPVIGRLIFQNLQAGWSWTSRNNYQHYFPLKISDDCKKQYKHPLAVRDTALHKIEEYSGNCFEIYYK